MGEKYTFIPRDTNRPLRNPMRKRDDGTRNGRNDGSFQGPSVPHHFVLGCESSLPCRTNRPRALSFRRRRPSFKLAPASSRGVSSLPVHTLRVSTFEKVQRRWRRKPKRTHGARGWRRFPRRERPRASRDGSRFVGNGILERCKPNERILFLFEQD